MKPSTLDINITPQPARRSSSVEQALYNKAHEFNFFRVLYLLETFSGGSSPGKGLSPSDDPVRFRVKPGLAFPASDIQEIREGENGKVPEMTVNFMGLVGPNGVLPHWYNVHAQNRNYRKDYALTDFFDLFHQRLLSLFYLAWKKYRLAENFTLDCSDPISSSLSHLAGIDDKERTVAPEFSSYVQRLLIFFGGLASRTVPTAATIETIVSHTMGTTVNVEQFVERMIPLHLQDRTVLGAKNSTLQKDALCGSSIRDTGSFFRVHIGPMSWKQYMAFAPSSRNLEMIKQLIGYLAGIEYEFSISLIILGQEIPALPLGAGGDKTPILGRTVLLRRPDRPYGKNVSVKAS
jgi:type VI secretion system protein ImpH